MSTFKTNIEQFTERMKKMGVKFTDIECSSCKHRLTQRQAKYSYYVYRSYLCYSCQRFAIPIR